MFERVKNFLFKNKLEIIGIIFIILCGIGVTLISNTFLLAPDEYNYSHIAWTDKRINSISDIVESQKSMYKLWTGRIPVHFIIQLLLYKGIEIFKVLNIGMFCALIILINKVFGQKLKLSNVVITVFVLFFMVKDFADKFMWMSGTVNYLWTCVFMLMAMKYFYKRIIKEENISIVKNILFILVCFFAGWSQENVAFLLGAYIIVLSLYKIKYLIKLNIKEKILILLNIVSFGIGAMLLIFAPGNFGRLEIGSGESLISLSHILRCARHIAGNLVGIKFLIVTWFITAGVILFDKNVIENKIEKKKFCIEEFIIFFVPLIVGITPMLLLDEFPARAMMPYENFLLVCVIYNINKITENTKRYEKMLVGIGIICFVCIVFKLGININNSYKILLPYKNEVLNQISECKEKGIKDVVINKLDDDEINLSKGWFLNYTPSSEVDGVINIYMARYYGLNSIVSIKEVEDNIDK